MIDHWFGKVLDAIERNDLAKDTMIILCTDHGHYLGEKDIWGKPGVPIFETMGRIPLLIQAPGVGPGTCDALTTSVDLHATLAEAFGVTQRQTTHGRSLLALLRGETNMIRDWALTGVWGREVCLVADGWKYLRGPAGANEPLSMLSNRWSTMPTHVLDKNVALPLPDERAFLDRMPGSNVPVIHQTWTAKDAIPFWARVRTTNALLFNLRNDPQENVNLAGTDAEAAMARKLTDALSELGAPATQFERLGLHKQTVAAR